MNKKQSAGIPILIKIYERLFNTFGPQHWWPGDSPFEVMVGAILTQNTNWQNVEKAINNIKRANLLHPHKLLENREKISQLIRPSGFYKLKSKRLISFLKYFVERYNGEVKNFNKKETNYLRNELLSVPGIGPETADSILLYALNRPVFVVDAYTRRMLKRHNLISEKADYNDIQKFFESNLPRDIQLYNEYHALIVRLGKEYCKKNDPLCDICPIHNILV
ncbi:MAG: endonuclease III domain-containing protein [candidate division WOR-3 bacterium]